GGPRWFASCRSTPSSSCFGARSREGRATGYARLEKPPPPPGTPRREGLDEAAALWWRREVTPATLRRDGRRWTAWTARIGGSFAAPGVVLLLLSPLTAPVALLCFAHAWLVPRIQA